MSTAKLERIAKLEAEMDRLKQRKAKLLQEHNAQERKARNHRLCKRSGLIEKVLPGLADLTDAQFDSFVKRTLTTGYAEKILREIETAKPKCEPSPVGNNQPSQEGKTADHVQLEKSAQPSVHPTPRPTQTQAVSSHNVSAG